MVRWNSDRVAQLDSAQRAELRNVTRSLGTHRIGFETDYPLYAAPEYPDILHDPVGLTDRDLNDNWSEK
jgi:hypothetical protein